MYDYALDTFAKIIEEKRLQVLGILVHQHGRLVGERRWAHDVPRDLYSASKSFTSIGIGMAIDDGLLSLADRPAELLSDLLPHTIAPNAQATTLKDLLMMASGQDAPHLLRAQRNLLTRNDWIAHYFEQSFPYAPGTHFLYDTGCTYVAGAMLCRAAGETILSFLMKRLFAPMGIPYPRWDACPKGLPLAGGGLYLTLGDLSKLGQLCLNKGVWNGQRLVSGEWLLQATAKHIDPSTGSPHDLGYGYQFWQGQHGSYRADGANGQYCIVLPELDAAVTIQSNEKADTAAIQQAVWDGILPSLEKGA